MERRVASDILLNTFHERYSLFEKCAVKFNTVAKIVRAERVAGNIYCESIIVNKLFGRGINEKSLNLMEIQGSYFLQSGATRNRTGGHKDFQSFALPTELWHHFYLFCGCKGSESFGLCKRLEIKTLIIGYVANYQCLYFYRKYKKKLISIRLFSFFPFCFRPGVSAYSVSSGVEESSFSGFQPCAFSSNS